MDNATIYALSTPFGKSAVAVIRLSGPLCLSVLQRLAPNLPQIEPRRAHLVTLIDPSTSSYIDKALAFYFKAPMSFTGEDCLEFHCHGSGAVIRHLLDVLSAIDGLRLAEPGEFTRRAWLNEKMDMAEAEALLNLIEAETRAQKEKALRIMSGALSNEVSRWRDQLIEALAYLEVSIDFVDEDDISDETALLALPVLREVHGSMRKALEGAKASVRLQSGLQVALSGVPNAGKSSLLNTLAKRDVAIVTEVPGTTRDVLEVFIELDGLPVIVRDTAGLRDTIDKVEAIGVSRARAALEAADLVILFVNEAEENERAALEKAVEHLPQERIIRLHNKADLGTNLCADVSLSLKSGEGLEAFYHLLIARAHALLDSESYIANERQLAALALACQELEKSVEGLGEGSLPIDLVAEHVHLAERALQRLIGRIDVEDVLDRIFSSFCIGK